MAAIVTKKYPDGTKKYQIRIRTKGVRPFFHTVDTREDAEQWIKENEYLYLLDPDAYVHRPYKRRQSRMKVAKEIHGN